MSVDLPAGMVSYWDLETGAGDGHGPNTPTNVNGVTFDGTAATFVRTASQALEVLTPSWSTTSSWTFAAWRRIGTPGNYRMIASQGATGNDLWWITTLPPELNVFVRGGGATGLNAGVPDPAGEWALVLLAYDAGTQTIHVATNGTAALSSSPGAAMTPGGPFWFGRYHGGEHWDGSIKRAGFWQRVLTPEEWTALYNGGAGLAYGDIVLPAIDVTLAITLGACALAADLEVALETHAELSVTLGPCTLLAALTVPPPFASDIDAALVTRLAADPVLQVLLPHGVHVDVPPPGSTAYAIVSLASHAETYMFPGATAYESYTYLVKAVTLGTSGLTVREAAQRIQALLHNQALGAVGYADLRLQRLRYLRDTEVDDVTDVRWQHRGGYYHVMVQPL